MKSTAYALLHKYKLRGVPKYIEYLRTVNYHRTFNFAIVKHLFKVVKNPQLLVPSARYDSVHEIPFPILKKMGFLGVVIDKDNTLTLPYEYEIKQPEIYALESAKLNFPNNNVTILSNTLGNLRLQFEEDYDVPDLLHHVPVDWTNLELFEKRLVFKRREVLRSRWRDLSRTNRKVRLYYELPIVIHSTPKPDCFQDIMDHFADISAVPRILPDQIVLIGDRVLTDVLQGNMHGMYTILVKPISPENDQWVVQFARGVENLLLRLVYGYGKLTSPSMRVKLDQSYKDLRDSLVALAPKKRKIYKKEVEIAGDYDYEIIPGKPKKAQKHKKEKVDKDQDTHSQQEASDKTT